MPSVSKNALSCGVEPSPTPMIPISGLSITVTCAVPGQRCANRLAAIQPAVPPPRMTMRPGALSALDATFGDQRRERREMPVGHLADLFDNAPGIMLVGRPVARRFPDVENAQQPLIGGGALEREQCVGCLDDADIASQQR